ncbi:mitochondrial carrier [Backusella circina FSU 941]|nr:mitochondrial carrier [Backusella circina FSU 941]
MSTAQTSVNLVIDDAHTIKEILPTRKTVSDSSTLEKIASAFSGAVITMSFMNPLDVVKTRLQEKGSSNQYRGTLDGIAKIVKKEGVFALWRSLVPGLVMALPSTGIYFVGYDHIRDAVRQTRFANTNVDIYSPLWAGGLARTMAALVVSPLELLRTRMQSTEGAGGFLGVWRGVSNMVKREGPQALWRGLVPTMLRDVPFSGLYWMGYEQIKQRLDAQQHITLSHFQTSFTAGATSGMVAAALTTPFDVIKTQRQVNSNASGWFPFLYSKRMT